ncbi:40S ribosomal protein S10-2 [Hibiscus syriacus]|uniref:40S ribosomal protein S10-2 n=1 Tax=Hibiscus syriacus TaxID=106335 RepID=A0A6A2Y489_HIBSY|nr:40S ribosomal protein S10-2 [Hibiscus syriacus]
MIIPEKNRREISKYLFQEGICYAKKDYNLAKHPETDVPNLQVIKLMQSFKSKESLKLLLGCIITGDTVRANWHFSHEARWGPMVMLPWLLEVYRGPVLSVYRGQGTTVAAAVVAVRVKAWGLLAWLARIVFGFVG